MTKIGPQAAIGNPCRTLFQGLDIDAEMSKLNLCNLTHSVQHNPLKSITYSNENRYHG